MRLRGWYQRLVTLLWEGHDLWGVAIWLGSGTVSNVLLQPLFGDLAMWIKVVYGTGHTILALALSAIVVRFLFNRSGDEGVSQTQDNSPGAIQVGDHQAVGGDFAGRDIDKSVHINVAPTVRQPIAPEIGGIIRGPSILVSIKNTDSQLHQFKVVFHSVTGVAGKPRVRDLWLPWDCGDWQSVGPKQSRLFQIAQADGEDRRIGKVIRFTHNKGRQYVEGYLST